MVDHIEIGSLEAIEASRGSQELSRIRSRGRQHVEMSQLGEGRSALAHQILAAHCKICGNYHKPTLQDLL